MSYQKALALLSFCLLLSAALATEALCNKVARASWYDYNYTQVDAYCGDFEGFSNSSHDRHYGYGWQLSSASVVCPRSSAYGWAFAGNRRTSTYGYEEHWKDEWSTLGPEYTDRENPTGENPDSIFSFGLVDTTSVIMREVGTGILLAVTGVIKTTPCSKGRVKVRLHQNNDTTQVIFNGEININGTGSTWSVTGFDPGDFLFYVSGDTAVVDFSDTVFVGPISYSGPLDSVGVTLIADIGASNIPIPVLTPYGIVVLLVSLLALGIYLVRHRREAVPA